VTSLDETENKWLNWQLTLRQLSTGGKHYNARGGGATAVRATVHSAPPPPGDRRRLAWRARPGPRPAMEYPHWLMVAGAVLVALGFIGFAFSKKN
jgi:hypothetical protein